MEARNIVGNSGGRHAANLTIPGVGHAGDDEAAADAEVDGALRGLATLGAADGGDLVRYQRRAAL